MATIVWAEAQPSDTSLVGRGPQDITSMWREIETGLRQSLYWSGVSYGELKPGTSRAAVAADSAASYGNFAFTYGRALLTSDETRLFGYTGALEASRATVLLGTPRLIEHNTDPGRAAWVMRSDETFIANANDGLSPYIAYGVTYDGIPNVYAVSSNSSYNIGIATVENDQFKVTLDAHNTNSSVTVRWLSSGTVTGDVT